PVDVPEAVVPPAYEYVDARRSPGDGRRRPVRGLAERFPAVPTGGGIVGAVPEGAVLPSSENVESAGRPACHARRGGKAPARRPACPGAGLPARRRGGSRRDRRGAGG